MNIESSKVQNEVPSEDLVRSLGWKEESPGVYVGGEECVQEEPSSLVTIDPAEWDEKLDQVVAEAAELIEQRTEEAGENVLAAASVEGAAVEERVEIAVDSGPVETIETDELNTNAQSSELSGR